MTLKLVKMGSGQASEAGVVEAGLDSYLCPWTHDRLPPGFLSSGGLMGRKKLNPVVLKRLVTAGVLQHPPKAVRFIDVSTFFSVFIFIGKQSSHRFPTTWCPVGMRKKET